MRINTRGARAYVGLSFATAMFIGVWSAPQLAGVFRDSRGWLLGALALAAAVLNGFRVHGPGKLENYDVAWALYGFTAVSLGLPAMLSVILVANLSTFLLRRFQWPWYVHAFNVCSFFVAAATSMFVFDQAPSLTAFHAVAAIGLMALVFTLVNHAHVAGVLWLNNNVSPLKSGLFKPASLLADGALIGIGALSAWASNLHPVAIALAIPPIVLIYMALMSISPKKTQAGVETGAPAKTTA